MIKVTNPSIQKLLRLFRDIEAGMKTSEVDPIKGRNFIDVYEAKLKGAK